MSYDSDIQIDIHLTDGGKTISVTAPYSYVNNTDFKFVGGRFSSRDRAWLLPNGPKAQILLDRMFGVESAPVVVRICPPHNAMRILPDMWQLGGYVLCAKPYDYAPARLEQGVWKLTGEWDSNQLRGTGLVFAATVRRGFAMIHELEILE